MLNEQVIKCKKKDKQS